MFGFDLGVFGLCFTPRILWHLGHPDQAPTKSREALGLAQELSHPVSQTVALDYAAMLHQFRREENGAEEQAQAAMAICAEQGFACYLAWASIIQGWTLSKQGHIEQGRTQMRQGIAALRATAAEVRGPYYLGLLAEACGQAGQVEEGLRMLDEALALVDKSGERWGEAELQRPLFSHLRQAQHRQGVCDVGDVCRQNDTRDPKGFALLENLVGRFSEQFSGIAPEGQVR